MIPAQKSRLFSAWFSRHAQKRIARTFARVQVHGLAHLEGALAQGPVILVSNHTSFWDPLVSIWLCTRLLRIDAYAMMDAKNLRRLPFFARVGAFGVDLDNPGDGARALEYARGLLDAPRRLVWIFAQGRERPVSERPLGFRSGSVRLAAAVPHASVVPLALRYHFGDLERPYLYVAIGPRLPAGAMSHEPAVTALLDALETDIRDGAAKHKGHSFLVHRAGLLSRVAIKSLALLSGRSRLEGGKKLAAARQLQDTTAPGEAARRERDDKGQP